MQQAELFVAQPVTEPILQMRYGLLFTNGGQF